MNHNLCDSIDIRSHDFDTSHAISLQSLPLVSKLCICLLLLRSFDSAAILKNTGSNKERVEFHDFVSYYQCGGPSNPLKVKNNPTELQTLCFFGKETPDLTSE